MIKHIVVWRLKESAHDNDKATNARLIKQKLQALDACRDHSDHNGNHVRLSWKPEAREDS